MKEYLITFKKKNGDTFVRSTNSIRLPLKGIGHITSMGWTIVDIHTADQDGNYYHKKDLERIERKRKKSIRKKLIQATINKLTRWA